MAEELESHIHSVAETEFPFNIEAFPSLETGFWEWILPCIMNVMFLTSVLLLLSSMWDSFHAKKHACICSPIHVTVKSQFNKLLKSEFTVR